MTQDPPVSAADASASLTFSQLVESSQCKAVQLLCSQVPNPPVLRPVLPPLSLPARGSDRTEPVCQLRHKTLFSLGDSGLTGEPPPGRPRMTDVRPNE